MKAVSSYCDKKSGYGFAAFHLGLFICDDKLLAESLTLRVLVASAHCMEASDDNCQ